MDDKPILEGLKVTTDDMTILDLPKVLKLARENALLGFYETSLKKYNQALVIIQKRQSELTEAFIKQKWKMTELNVKSEIAQTKQILDLCKTLKINDFDYSKRQMESEEDYQRRVKDENIMVFDMNPKKGVRSKGNINYFGKKPFQLGNSQGSEDPFENFKYDEINGLGRGVNERVYPDYDDRALLSKTPTKTDKRGSNYKIPRRANSNANSSISSTKSSSNYGYKNNKNDKSMINPLDKFNINNESNMSIAGFDDKNEGNSNTTFINEIRNFMVDNNMQSGVRNAYQKYDERPIKTKWTEYNNSGGYKRRSSAGRGNRGSGGY